MIAATGEQGSSYSEFIVLAVIFTIVAIIVLWPKVKAECEAWREAGRVYRAGELDSGIPARTPLPSLPKDGVEFESGLEGRAISCIRGDWGVEPEQARSKEPGDGQVGPLSHCRKVPRLYDWEHDLWMGLEDVQ